jgi:uracil-DNA glycosylase
MLPDIEDDHNGWSQFIRDQRAIPYFVGLEMFVEHEYHTSDVFPPKNQVFRAMELTPLSEVKVVILGQDPYHGAGQAHGLSFSVPGGVPLPPSLRNIFKELDADLHTGIPHCGDLQHWARQGVLLLNTVLTVRAGMAASHQRRGWEQFTDNAIKKISGNNSAVVFILWGNHARGKEQFIDKRRHLVLTAAHPSPLSAHAGFWGCGHFSKTNEFLKLKSIEPIDWRLSS